MWFKREFLEKGAQMFQAPEGNKNFSNQTREAEQTKKEVRKKWEVQVNHLIRRRHRSSCSMTRLSARTVSFVDDEGNPATLPAGAVPAWALVDPDGTLGITPSADGLSCVIKASGKLTVMQAAQVNVSAGPLSGSVQIQVNASAAAALAIGLGTPAHQ